MKGFVNMSNYVNHKKGVKLSESDIELLESLYKVDFLCSYHAALIIGESEPYTDKRMKDLAKAGLICRKVLKANCPCANWITKKGITAAGLPPRNVRPPTLGRYEHSLGVADMFVFLCLRRKRKDGSIFRFATFGSIISERDFFAVREMKQTGTKKNGQPIYTPLDNGIHAPDGYFFNGVIYYSLEFERTAKSTYKVVRENVIENSKRFAKQFWIYDHKSVYNFLLKIQKEVGRDKMQIIDIRTVREQLQKAVAILPAVISKKSGRPRQSAFGKMTNPTPLNRIPILSSAVKTPVLESRSKKTKPLSKSTPSFKAPIPSAMEQTKNTSAPPKPTLRLEKRRKG